ncbi:MAG: MaoC family dehydratase N-terminal domain-containing protein [Novosphingobium sp.]
MAHKAKDADWGEATGAQITEEHIERARFLVGYDEALSRRENMSVASEDHIRAYARSYGDDNPLHCDADYAGTTRWGSVTAPGTMALLICSPLKGDPRPSDIARAKKGLFQRIHQLHSSTDWEWYRPIRPGDRIYRFAGEESVDVKQSEFAGTSVLRVSRNVAFNQEGEVVCIQRLLLIHSGRSTAAKRGKYMAIEPAQYTDDDLAAIDAIYAAEQVRGSEPRYWEDVAIEDSLGVMAKGPLTVSDIICLHSTGFALLPFGPATSRIAYKRRQKMPASFVKDSKGIPDTIMRMHWDDDWARAVGSPMAYDYGFQRECWALQFLTDWCGDDAIVLRMKNVTRKFNYLGDFQKVTGEVVDRRIEDGRAVVDVKVNLVSQRGETTMEAFATVALPSRKHGEANYPDPPADIAAKAKAFLARHRELSAETEGGR